MGIVACAIYFARHENIPSSPGPLGAVRLLIWAAFFGFTGYSFYCSFKENLFTTIGKLAKLHWGRQIGLDLYLGLSLILFVIYLNEGSLRAVLLWLLPTLVVALRGKISRCRAWRQGRERRVLGCPGKNALRAGCRQSLLVVQRKSSSTSARSQGAGASSANLCPPARPLPSPAT